jgi:hypothetical protein
MTDTLTRHRYFQQIGVFSGGWFLEEFFARCLAVDPKPGSVGDDREAMLIETPSLGMGDIRKCLLTNCRHCLELPLAGDQMLWDHRNERKRERLCIRR